MSAIQDINAIKDSFQYKGYIRALNNDNAEEAVCLLYSCLNRLASINSDFNSEGVVREAYYGYGLLDPYLLDSIEKNGFRKHGPAAYAFIMRRVIDTYSDFSDSENALTWNLKVLLKFIELHPELEAIDLD